MNRIGILTYHNNDNKGAILQSWCLSRVLQESNSGVKVDVIDYRTCSKEIGRLSSVITTRKISQIPDRYRDWRICEKFLEEDLPTSGTKIQTDKHSKAVSQLKNMNYDVLFVGSDEVWKINPTGSGIPILSPTRPFPNLYFLDNTIRAKKVSYAASANSLDPKSLTKERISEMQARLESFDLISVRDQYTEDLLRSWGFKDLHRVPDPTILCEIQTKEVEPIFNKNGIDIDEEILCIHGPNNQLFKDISDHFRGQGYRIISMTGSNLSDVDLLGQVGPFEYYTAYQYFDKVVTSSLHSTIFSLKHRTPFVTIDTSPIYRDKESKTHSLLKEFDMLERHFEVINRDVEDISNQIEVLEEPIDSQQVAQKIDHLQRSGKEFLNLVESEYEKNN